MTEAAKLPADKFNAHNVVKIDGSKKTWPARLDGVEVSFPIFPSDATPDLAFEYLRAMSDDGDGLVAWIRSNVEASQSGDLRSFLNGKAREEGKTYTRDEIKKLPTRSEKIAKEDVVAFGNSWTLPKPRVSATTAKLSAAEAKTRKIAAEKDAAMEALIGTLRALHAKDKKAAQTQLESMIGAGILPADTTL